MFILIMGVTGSGKTTIGTLLSAALGWPFYDADHFHSVDNVRKMASGVALTDADRGPWLKTLNELIAQHGKEGKNGVLACSALKDQYRRVLSANADVALVYLKADRELVRSRLDRRSGHYMPQSLIESQFVDLQEPENCIVIDAAGPLEQKVETIRSELEKKVSASMARRPG